MVFWIPTWYAAAVTTQLNKPYEALTAIREDIHYCLLTFPASMAVMCKCLEVKLQVPFQAILMAYGGYSAMSSPEGCIYELPLKIARLGDEAHDWKLFFLPLYKFIKPGPAPQPAALP